MIAEIERDLARLLSVEPSPDFAQRVRTRIADAEAGAGTRGWGYGLVAAAALLALVAAGALYRRSQDPPPAVGVASTPRYETHAAAGAAGGGGVGVRRETPDAAVPGGTVSRSTAARPRIVRRTEPEVLVPDERRIAIQRLLDMARAGTLDERAFPPEARTVADGEPGEPVAPIAVEGLQVKPLVDIDEVEESLGRTVRWRN
jgi:hypothetical protein